MILSRRDRKKGEEILYASKKTAVILFESLF